MSNLVAATSRTSFVQSVIQHALDHGLVTTDWVGAFSADAQRIADHIAERETRQRAPTENEVRGSQVRLQQYLTLALDHLAWGNIDQAAHILASTPLRQLMQVGQKEFQETRRVLRQHVRDLDRQSGRLLEVNPSPLETIGWWVESTIEDLGRDTLSSNRVESVFGWLVFYKHEAELGLILDRRLTNYSRYLPLSFSQLVGNLSVNLLIHSRPDGSITLADIKQFMQRIVRNGQADQGFIDHVGERLAQTLVGFGASPTLANWLRHAAWPKYAEIIVHTAQFRLSRLLCLDNLTFFPAVTRRSKEEATRPDLQAEEKAFEGFCASSIRRQLEMLEALPDVGSRNLWLLRLEQWLGPIGPIGTAMLFTRLPVRQICLTLRLHRVYRRDFDHHDETLPKWIIVYLEQLKLQPKTRQHIIDQFLRTRRPTRIRGEKPPKPKQ